MEASAFKSYLTDRYQDQISWYQRKAATNKSRYQIFQWTVIVLSAIVPVLVALPIKYQVEYHQLLTIVVSVFLAIGTAGVKAFKFQENWINYRSTSERLIQEKYYYEGNVGEYSETGDKESLFVKRVEALLAGESSQWVSTQKSPGGG